LATLEIDRRIRRLLVLHLDVAAEELTAQSRLSDDLGVDSLTAVELLMILEDEFDISLPEDEMGDLTTFGDLVTAVTGEVVSRA